MPIGSRSEELTRARGAMQRLARSFSVGDGRSAGLVCFLKIAARPRYAMVCLLADDATLPVDLGRLDLVRSFGFEVPRADHAPWPERVATWCGLLHAPVVASHGSTSAPLHRSSAFCATIAYSSALSD
jgi:hypothetical protein